MIFPGDLLTDADLRALDSRLDNDYGETLIPTLVEKRRVAVQDWLVPKLETFRYAPAQHQTRVRPVAAFGYTGGVYTDVCGALGDATAGDLDLAQLWATPATDALYVAASRPFVGLSVSMVGTGNSAASVATVSVWSGSGWAAVPQLADGTRVALGKSFSGGGRFSWALPEEWAPRLVNGAGPYVWARLTVDVAPSAGTAADQILPVVRSRLTYPLALYTLSLIYREGASGRRGGWLEQADSYAEQAEKQLAAVLPLIGDEFDTDADGAVTAADASPVPDLRGWSLERA